MNIDVHQHIFNITVNFKTLNNNNSIFITIFHEIHTTKHFYLIYVNIIFSYSNKSALFF